MHTQADTFMKTWLAGIPVQQTKLLLDVKNPVVFISSDERNLGTRTNKGLLSSELLNLMTREGFVFTQSKSHADMTLLIEANTEEGASTSGIMVAYLNASFKLVDTKDNTTLYHKSLNRIKGVQLSYRKAGLEAYANAVASLRRSIVEDMVSSLF